MTATKAILSEVLNFGVCILLEGTGQISAVKTDPDRRVKITYSEKIVYLLQVQTCKEETGQD